MLQPRILLPQTFDGNSPIECGQISNWSIEPWADRLPENCGNLDFLDDQISWKMSRNDNTRINFGCKMHGFKLTGSRFANCLNGMPLLERDLERPKCEDIDECQLGVYKCQTGEICENTEGGYRCVNETMTNNVHTVDAELMEILRYENMKLRTSYLGVNEKN